MVLPRLLVQFAPVKLTVDFGDVVEVSAQAVQVAWGVGVAVAFSPDASSSLVPLVARAKAGGDLGVSEPEHREVGQHAKLPSTSVDIAKSDGARMPILQVARTRVIGGC